MWAAAKGHPETMQALVAAGADVNACSTIVVWERQRTDEPRDKWLPPGGWKPLLLAARENCVASVDVLRGRRGPEHRRPGTVHGPDHRADRRHFDVAA